MHPAGALEERLALAQRVGQPAYDVGGGQRARPGRRAAREGVADVSLPQTPQADEPADRASCCWGSVGGAAARVTVTTLKSCSGVRVTSVQ